VPNIVAQLDCRRDFVDVLPARPRSPHEAFLDIALIKRKIDCDPHGGVFRPFVAL
jgi:hypothetical protein